MIENMTQREKTLAGATAGALVVALLFGAFFWFLGSYNENVTSLQSIDSRISDQKNITKQGLQAATRKRYYLKTSPTSNISDVKFQYMAWLKKTLREDIGVNLPSVPPGKNLTLKSGSKIVARQTSFTIRPSLTLKQLVGFLDAFYSVDTLHRITSLRLTPRTDGQLKSLIKIEVLALTDGEERDHLATVFRDAGIPIEKAIDTIVRRDVFGPANNSPTVKINKSSSYNSGKPVSISVTASDIDKEDVLTMELIETEVEGAKLKPDAKGSKGKLTIPGQPAGRYEFVIRITDNGLPEKSIDKKVQITFKDPKKTPAKPPEAPPEKMAVETRITGNYQNAAGIWCILIESRIEDRSERLSKGDSFELDNRDWEVTDITRKSATFIVDGQEVELDRGVPFSEAEFSEDED